MELKELGTQVGISRTGRAKFWVCPRKGIGHGEVKFRVGQDVIPKKRVKSGES